MQITRVEILISLFFIVLLFGCSLLHKPQPPEPAQIEPSSLEPAPGVTPEMVQEYAMIHQISDPKKAEFYLTHPDYAKAHPYVPTQEDISFYESKFIEKMHPGFEKLADRVGFMKARSIYMRFNPDTDSGPDDAGAIRVVEEIFKRNAQIESELSHAEELYNEGKLDEAIRHMETALQVQPDSPTMLYNLGVMHMKKGNYQSAIQCFQGSLEHLKGTGYTQINLLIHPSVYMGASINLGLIYTRLGMYNEAVEILTEATRFCPSDFDANWNPGVAYYTMGDTTKAIPQFRKCIDLDPSNAEVHNAIGLLYYNMGLYYAALDEFREASKLNPKEKQYSYNEGLVLARLGRNDEAIHAFKRAEGLKEGEEVRHVFTEQVNANKAKELYNDGCTAMEHGSIFKAIDLFESALNLKPDMVEAYVNLGVCYKLKGDVQKQIYYLEESAKLRPDMPDVYYDLGLAYSSAGMYLNARYAFERAVELNPSFKDAHFNLGTMFYKTSRFADAVREFEKCIELSPDWFEAHLNLGTCYLKLGETDKAMRQFESAVQLKPNSAEAHYSLGIACMKTKRFDEASTLFKKTLELDPHHGQAQAMLKELENYRSAL